MLFWALCAMPVLNLGGSVGKILFFTAVLCLSLTWSSDALAGEASGDTPGDVYNQAQKALDLKFNIQRQLQSLNDAFDLGLASPKDAEDFLTYRLLEPKTEAEQLIKSAFQHHVPIIQNILQQLKFLESDLSQTLQVTMNQTHRMNNRVLGVKVPEVFPLYVGGLISGNSKSTDTSLKAPRGVGEVCFSDPSRKTDSVDFFLNATHGNMSCIQSVDQVELLEDGAEALSRKIEILTGSPLPRAAIENPDPNYALDFSKAPVLKTILMSYLEYKHDFSGRMMFQALKYHSDRGAQIRILVPGLLVGNFVHAKDQQLLDQMAAWGPNVEIKKFRFGDSRPDFKTPFLILSRSQHAKMMVVIGEQPENNGVVLGGRNIKDTFYMKKAPDYSRWPEMVQYNGPGEKFGVFRDMEIYVGGAAFAEQAAAQYLSFYHFNTHGPKVIRTTAHLENISIADEHWQRLRDDLGQGHLVRQFISLPYLDKRATEQMFVDMIDSARVEVRLVTPYLRPLAAIRAAMIRAIRRGVRIELLTLFDLGNDNVAPFTEDMNKMSVNKLMSEYAKIKKKNKAVANMDKLLTVRQWNEESVMHSKVVTIDNKVMFVGSINFDQRGLTEDSENGVLVTGPAVEDFDRIYKTIYVPTSVVLEKKQRVNMLYPLLIMLLDKLNMT